PAEPSRVGGGGGGRADPGARGLPVGGALPPRGPGTRDHRRQRVPVGPPACAAAHPRLVPRPPVVRGPRLGTRGGPGGQARRPGEDRDRDPRGRGLSLRRALDLSLRGPDARPAGPDCRLQQRVVGRGEGRDPQRPPRRLGGGDPVDPALRPRSFPTVRGDRPRLRRPRRAGRAPGRAAGCTPAGRRGRPTGAPASPPQPRLSALTRVRSARGPVDRPASAQAGASPGITTWSSRTATAASSTAPPTAASTRSRSPVRATPARSTRVT